MNLSVAPTEVVVRVSVWMLESTGPGLRRDDASQNHLFTRL